MIYIAKITADPNGLLPIRNYPDSGDYNSTARILRNALLDGTTYIENRGAPDTDLDLVIDCRVSESEKIRLEEIQKSGLTFRLSYWRGSYLATIKELFIKRNNETTITFYFKEKLR
jgi:hypothetical protein